MKKKISILSFVLVLSLVLSACGGNSNNAASPSGSSSGESPSPSAASSGDNAKEGGVIGVIPKSTLYDYWKFVHLGADEAAAEHGYTVTWQGTATDTDVEGQVKIVEDFITRGVKAIVISPVNPHALVPALQDAHDKGIPVIIIDGKLNADFPYSTISTNNQMAGKQAAAEMAKLIGDQGGKAAIVSEVAGSVQGNDRESGFVEGMKEAQGVELLNTFYSEGDRNKAFNITQDIITSTPDIKGIFSTNEGSSVGVMLAIEALNKQDVAVIGFDASLDQIEGIKKGIIDGTIAQSPWNIGYTGVTNAIKVLNGESVEKTVDVETVYINKDNVDSEEVKKMLTLPEGY